jgi:DNA-binding NarL/FixJ family response regulator
MTISLLLVDDHPVVRDGLAAMLSTQEDFDVAGAAANASEAVGLAIRTRPDVALIDLELPPTSGIEAIANVLAVSPQTRVLVFTAYKNDERVLGAVDAGAHGYLLKGTPRNEIFEAIRAVHTGKTVFEGEVARVIGRKSAPATEVLTDRQQQVVQLLVHGLSNKEMALQLRISERTVKYHLAAVFDRLGVGNRTEAVAAAMQSGLVRAE